MRYATSANRPAESAKICNCCSKERKNSKKWIIFRVAPGGYKMSTSQNFIKNVFLDVFSNFIMPKTIQSSSIFSVHSFQFSTLKTKFPRKPASHTHPLEDVTDEFVGHLVVKAKKEK